MSDINNNIPTRITQLEEATEYEDGMFYAVAKAGRGTYKIPVDEMTPNEQALSDKMENEIVPAVENSFAYGTVDESEIASFQDGSELPLKVLEVAVNPVQDLHGYDSPWPAGAGKNKCKPISGTTTEKGITITPQSDGSIILNGTKTTDDSGIRITGSYATVANQTQIASIVGVSPLPTGIEDFGFIGYGKNSFITPSSSYSDSGIQVFINQGTTLANVRLYPQIEMGSSRTSYEPYSNECPIVGRSAVDVSVSGVNVWDEEWRNGYYNNGVFIYAADGICCKNKIPIKPNTTLYYVKNFDITTNFYYTFYDKNGDFLRVSGYDGSGRIAKSLSGAISVPNGAYFMTFNMGSGYGTIYNNDISINYPSTNAEYHAYNTNSTTYTINLNGTRYGGKLRIINGVAEFVATYAKKALADISKSKYGTYQYGVRAISSFFDSIPNSSLLTGMSNTFVLSTSGESYNVDKCSILFANGSSKTSFLISTQASGLSEDASVTEINEWLRSIDANIVYPLATPITIPLGEVEIDSLKGYNNISADTGNILKVEYIRDLDIVINSLLERIAALEG